MMDNAEKARLILDELRNRQIKLSIHDFDPLFSLSYLHRFPVYKLKIDRSFINRIGNDGENHEIVEAIIKKSENFGHECDRLGGGNHTTYPTIATIRLPSRSRVFAKSLSSEDARALIEENPQW